MNFKVLKTLKGERVCINLDKVLFFCETNKGIRLVFDDGCYYDYSNAFDEIIKSSDYGFSRLTNDINSTENSPFKAHILERFVPDVTKR